MDLDEFLDGGFEAAGADLSSSEDDSGSMDDDAALDIGVAEALEPALDAPGPQDVDSGAKALEHMHGPAACLLPCLCIKNDTFRSPYSHNIVMGPSSYCSY